MSIALGRPFSLYDEEYVSKTSALLILIVISMDLDFPVDCDDEYWDNPGHEFEQPAGQPSRVTFFIHMLKACQILSFAIRTIVSKRCSLNRLLILSRVYY